MKKGIVFETIVAVVLILIGLLIFGIVAEAYMFPSFKDAANRWICWFSAVKKSKSTWFGFKEGPELSKRCFREIKIDKKDNEYVLRTIAEEMYGCAWQLGRGKLNFYPDVDFKLGDNTRCVICASIYTKDDKYNTKIKVKDIQDYLNNEKVGGKTYAESLLDVEGAEIDWGLDKDDEFIISNKPTYVVFKVEKKRDWKKYLTGIGIAVGGTALLTKGKLFEDKFLFSKGALKTGIPVVIGLSVAGYFAYKPDVEWGLKLWQKEYIEEECKEYKNKF